MASTRAERVDNALQSLLERLVPPQQPGESEAAADQRWEDANALAADLVDGTLEASALGDTGVDVGHAADLIRNKLAKEGKAEAARSFGGLYSRLLTQPVLGRKWAILWFLMKLGEDTQAAAAALQEKYESPSAVFDTAFARNGLSSVSAETQQQQQSPVRDRTRPVPTRSKQQEEVAADVLSPVQDAKRTMEPSEQALLRDLPFTLQGLSSTHLPFADGTSIRIPSTLPIPLVSLLHALAEPSLLYRSLSEFVERADGGLVGQSLRAAVEVELRAYLRLVATLEGQVRRALAQIDETLPHQGLGKAGVTLKRCVVWTREATLGLRLMSVIVESAKEKKGGQLISLIHAFASSHGDPFVHTFAERLLSHATRPFYNMLRAWIYDGELEDPYLEFFVCETQDNDDVGATSVWEHKYRVKETMIPSIVTSDFAQRVFLIGKSLNFIRYGCGDSAWVESYSKSASRELHYGDTAMLSSSIDEAYKSVMARLLSLMETKFALFSHLTALKKYLLLGQGDFVALLMESLASNLDRPANSQYRHTLTAQLEHAITHSNAQYDSHDVLRRLDARMLELSHGEIGWDVFTLEYRVDSPLDVIITPWANRQYLKVFNFLWRVKRVEFALSTTWRRLQTGARGVLAAVRDDRLGADWKHVRGGLAEMIHFVDQLQYYILFEVIEKGWTDLEVAMRTPAATLDTLIEAHATYLRDITRKGLLGGGGGGSGSGVVVVDFTAQLHELLKLVLSYVDAVDALYSYSVADFTRRQDLAARIDSRTRAGRWGVTDRDSTNDDNDHHLSPPAPLSSLLDNHSSSAPDVEALDQLRSRLASLSSRFRARTSLLLGDLAHQPDGDMRFLAVVMNFNDVYVPAKRRRQVPQQQQQQQTAQAKAEKEKAEK